MVDLINLALVALSLVNGASGVKIDWSGDYVDSTNWTNGNSNVSEVSNSNSLNLVIYDKDTGTISNKSVSYSSFPSAETESKYPENYSGSEYSFDNHGYNTYSNCKKNYIVPNNSDRKKFKLSAICETLSKRGGAEIYGSAFVVSNNMIMSAAHCFYDKNGFYDSSYVGAIQHDDKSVFDAGFEVSKIIMPKSYYENINDNVNDWCICVLKKFFDKEQGNKYYDISHYTGYLSIASGYTLAGCYNYACGYPGDLPTSDNSYFKLSYSPASETNGYDDDFFYLNSYVVGGMSGGPVIFSYENSMTFESYEGVAGIITRTYINDKRGIAVRITNKIIETERMVEKYYA